MGSSANLEDVFKELEEPIAGQNRWRGEPARCSQTAQNGTFTASHRNRMNGRLATNDAATPSKHGVEHHLSRQPRARLP